MSATASERILLCGAAAMLIAALVLAWLSTFARLMPIAGIRARVKDYPSIIRAHIDLLLMALFCLAFARLPIKPPPLACLLVVIGGLTNPSLFVLRALAPHVSAATTMRVYRMSSFAISTIGFVWVAGTIVGAALR